MENPATQNIQDLFLNTARREKSSLVFHMMKGATLTGKIKSFDKFSILLDVEGEESLIFKHAVSNISVEKKTNNFQVKYLGRKTDNI